MRFNCSLTWYCLQHTATGLLWFHFLTLPRFDFEFLVKYLFWGPPSPTKFDIISVCSRIGKRQHNPFSPIVHYFVLIKLEEEVLVKLKKKKHPFGQTPPPPTTTPNVQFLMMCLQAPLIFIKFGLMKTGQLMVQKYLYFF